MRRADRLFEIIQIMRRRKLTRASDLAGELEVSLRTVYRDIADLIAQRVPITGEAGVGYMLEDGYDLPPMMLTRSEIEALVLGVRIIESWSDAEMCAAAGSLLAKVAAVLPAELRAVVHTTPLLAPADRSGVQLSIDGAELRRAIREQRYVDIDYSDIDGNRTCRRIRPLGLAFYGPVWLLFTWCELREDFRSFRLDRICSMKVGDERFPSETGRQLRDFLHNWQQWVDGLPSCTESGETREPQEGTTP
ncbi:MAG: YafY family transcriptional regulator [Geminicoccaceae bacterium]|nr:YafY family transcriptional regulator [Geminicoccaceae bacterium]MCB9945634.1 YafY family transcriptional regulator [Geminicoccaceae bacterium]